MGKKRLSPSLPNNGASLFGLARAIPSCFWVEASRMSYRQANGAWGNRFNIQNRSHSTIPSPNGIVESRRDVGKNTKGKHEIRIAKSETNAKVKFFWRNDNPRLLVHSNPGFRICV